MKIRVLGCSGAIARHCRTTAFLLDDDVLIDAGTGVGDLTLEALERIDDILLSHSHLDHVLGVPLLADSVLRRRKGRPPIRVHALAATLDVLQRHLLNDQLWPDFTRLPSPDAPALALLPFEIGQVLGLSGRRIEVLPAEHSVPAVGFAVHAAAGAWVFTGDTGPNPALWARLAQFEVAHLVIENAFSHADAALAARSGHHSPTTLAEELRSAPTGATLHVTHVKPGEAQAVADDIARCCPGHAVRLLEAGQEFALGD